MKYLFLLFLVIHLNIISQNVTIKGVGKSHANKEIGVWVSADYISNLRKEITYSTIDSVGNFVLEFNSKQIQYVNLKIEKLTTAMYVQPGTNYEIIILPPDSTTYQNPNIEHDVKLSINLKSKTEINSLTMDYDNHFDIFLKNSYLRYASEKKIDSFKVATHTFYSTVNNSFFDNYITYSIATVEEKTKEGKNKLFTNYLKGKQILYSNKEYMIFFNAFYKQAVQNFALSAEGSPLVFQINDKANLSGALNIMRREKYIPNDTIGELVLLKGLYESYYDGTFKRTGIVGILKQIAAESAIEEHKKIATNILNSFSKLQKGNSAPLFELPDKSGNMQALENLYTKKYVYLMFFDTACTSCLMQMKIISSLKKKYGEQINFVSVSTDKSNATVKRFCTKNPKYDWTFLHDNTNGDLKNKYEINDLPTCFLINPDGKFIQAPAESPDGDIDRAFYDITKIKPKKFNIGIKDGQ